VIIFEHLEIFEHLHCDSVAARKARRSGLPARKTITPTKTGRLYKQCCQKRPILTDLRKNYLVILNVRAGAPCAQAFARTATIKETLN
jgi:hypothetical protein